MVFDVEAVGLHGEGFAVGYVIIDTKTGEEIDSGIVTAPDDLSPGLPDDRAWIREHVVPVLDTHVPRERSLKCSSAAAVRRFFWDMWAFWRAQGAWLAADVAWPVEARFLAACIDDDRGRSMKGPYPLIDIASVRLAAGFDPLAHEDRWATELPAHNPLADARQSARLLLKALVRVGP